MSALDWQDEAACKGYAGVFFPPPEERATRKAKREALALQICAVCPVIDECHQFARRGDQWAYGGVWAGILPGTTKEQMHTTIREVDVQCVECFRWFTVPGPKRIGSTPQTCSDPCHHAAKLRRQAEYAKRHQETRA